MKEFALIFRVPQDLGAEISPAEMQKVMTSWMNWMGGIAAKDRLVSQGNRLGVKGSKWVSPGQIVSDGPYTEVKEFINGYIIVKGASVDEAVEFAKGCPVLQGEGNTVEVRKIAKRDGIH